MEALTTDHHFTQAGFARRFYHKSGVIGMAGASPATTMTRMRRPAKASHSSGTPCGCRDLRPPVFGGTSRGFLPDNHL